jgi:CheY-like chemotaxis protein
MRPTHFTILLIEDNENDRYLIEMAWQRTGTLNSIQCVNCGEEAVRYLKGEGKFRDRSCFAYPSFITTDLKMPNGDGFSVLQYLKSNPEWAVIPTCVLSASADPDDIKKSYMLGASCYHVKPSSYGDLLKMMSILLDYWMLCEVPEVDVTGKQIKTQSRGKLGQRILQAD